MKLTFAECLARDGVSQHVTLANNIGIMAYHGGALEKVTDVVAREVAARIGASCYAVTHPDDLVHVPSTSVDAAASPQLQAFLSHVDVVVSIHGFGREGLMRSVLLGGRNRALAEHIGGVLRPVFDEYDIVSDLSAIPPDLAGQHPRNPVNLPRRHGVQIELPPVLRWNRDHHGWSDDHPVPRAPQVDRFIDHLAGALASFDP